MAQPSRDDIAREAHYLRNLTSSHTTSHLEAIAADVCERVGVMRDKLTAEQARHAATADALNAVAAAAQNRADTAVATATDLASKLATVTAERDRLSNMVHGITHSRDAERTRAQNLAADCARMSSALSDLRRDNAALVMACDTHAQARKRQEATIEALRLTERTHTEAAATAEARTAAHAAEVQRLEHELAELRKRTPVQTIDQAGWHQIYMVVPRMASKYPAGFRVYAPPADCDAMSDYIADAEGAHFILTELSHNTAHQLEAAHRQARHAERARDSAIAEARRHKAALEAAQSRARMAADARQLERDLSAAQLAEAHKAAAQARTTATRLRRSVSALLTTLAAMAAELRDAAEPRK